jgi:hypothetical protein
MLTSTGFTSSHVVDELVAREVACEWVKQNRERWTDWIPSICPVGSESDDTLTTCRGCKAGFWCVPRVFFRRTRICLDMLCCSKRRIGFVLLCCSKMQSRSTRICFEMLCSRISINLFASRCFICPSIGSNALLALRCAGRTELSKIPRVSRAYVC